MNTRHVLAAGLSLALVGCAAGSSAPAGTGSVVSPAINLFPQVPASKVVVSSSQKDVPIAASDAFILNIPQAALSSPVSRFGSVELAAKTVQIADLQTGEQAAINRTTGDGASLLAMMQLDLNPSSNSSNLQTAGLHTRQ